MAKALQCPSCGTQRMVDTLDGSDSFPCATCGKVLKVPPALAAPNGAAPDAETAVPTPEPLAPVPEQLPPARRRRSSRTAAPAVASSAAVAQAAAADNPPGLVVASSAAPGAVPPPPRRRRRGPADGEIPVPSVPERVEPAPVAAIASDPVSTAPISAVAGAAAVGAGAAAAAAVAPRMVSSASPAATTLLAEPPDDTPAPQPKSKSKSRRGRAAQPDASPPLPLVIRILIWVIALPLGLALVGIPARKAGYLTSQKLLDVVIKHNLDRFFPLAVIVVLWALVTAIIVHLLAEGGRAWMAHRRKAHEASERPTVVSSGPGLAPPPRRRNGTNGEAAPQRESQAASRGGS